MKKTLILILLLSALPAFADRRMLPISQTEFKNSWAFKIKQATLLCEKETMAVALMDETGKIYWLNGIAKGVYKGSMDIEPIWLDNYLGKLKLGKKDISVFIEQGQKLCNR